MNILQISTACLCNDAASLDFAIPSHEGWQGHFPGQLGYAGHGQLLKVDFAFFQC